MIARAVLLLATLTGAVAVSLERRCAGCQKRLSRYADPRDVFCWQCAPSSLSEERVRHISMLLVGKCSAGLHDRDQHEAFVADERYAIHPDYGQRGYVYCRPCRKAKRRANGWK